MKTHLFFSLTLALVLFTACEKENDLAIAEPDVPRAETLKSYISDSTKGDDYITDAARAGLTRDYCIELSSAHWLVGFGSFSPVVRPQGSPYVSDRIRAGVWVIEAKGDGASDEYARSSSELELTFNASTRKITGTMITKFFGGEVLEQKFDSEVKIVYERYAMILKANVKAADFNTGSEALYLQNGEIIIALPLKPEGWFETNIYTKGMFCTAVTN